MESRKVIDSGSYEANQNSFFDQIGDFSQFLTILERVPNAMFMVKNLDSRYVFMSAALRQAIHVDDPSHVIGKTDFELFPKMIAESFRQNDLIVFEHGRPLINELHLTLFYSHAPRWSFSSKYPVLNRAGKVFGLVTINELLDDVRGKQAELNSLLPAIDHVSKNFADNISIAALAQLCGISESHFMRMFKQQLNMTAYGFVEQVRMFHAIESLKSGSQSILQIALDCGYYDHSSFVKRFKKFTGTTPLKYRSHHQSSVSTDCPMILPIIST